MIYCLQLRVIKNYVYMYFYTRMKFRNLARLCLAVFDFGSHIMLSLCLAFKDTGLQKLTPMWLRISVNSFSNFY